MLQDLYLHGVIGGSAAAEPLWTRPLDRLTMPALSDQVTAIYLLVAVFDMTNNNLAFTCTGDYTVDWGDGNTENVASGVKAQHNYAFSDLSSSTLTNDGFRQALVTITPNGGSLLTVDFNTIPDTAGGQSNIVEIKVSAPDITSLVIGQYFSSSNRWNLLERYELGINNLTSANGLFAYTYGLKEIVITGSLNGVTDASSMFAGCYALVNLTMPGLPNCTTVNYMFSECTSLVEAPLFDISNVSDISGMFNYCVSLSVVPLYDTSSATTAAGMFRDCANVRELPNFNLPLCTDISRMFYQCYALTAGPALTTSNLLLDTSYLYFSCNSMLSMELFDTSSVTNITQMFDGVHLVTDFPLYNFSSVTNMTNTFVNTYSLFVIPAYDFSSVTTGNLGTSVAGRSLVTGMTISHFGPPKAGTTELIEVFTNLGTAQGGATITVTNIPGTAGLTGPDLLIATNKGWTVVT